MADPVETAQPLTAEKAYLAVEVANHEEDGPRHIEDYEGTWFVRGWHAAMDATPPQPTAEALRPLTRDTDDEVQP